MLDDINPLQMVEQIGAAQAAPFAIKDLKHRFVYANSAFCETMGSRCEELIGRDEFELGWSREIVLGNPLSGWPGLWVLDDLAIEKKEISKTTDFVPGSQSTIETVRVPLCNKSGQAIALLVQLFDVSEVRELRQRIARNIDVLSLREGEISTMESVLASLMACQDTGTLLEQLAVILVERTRADCCYAATVHESGEFMEIVAASGNHSSEYLGSQFRRSEGTIGKVWHCGEAIFYKDVSVIQSIHQWPRGTQAFSLPLFVESEAVAALTVISDPHSEDLAEDVALLERICGMASMAIANTRLIDVTQNRLKVTRALAEVSQVLTTLDDVSAAYNIVCNVLLPAMDARRASIFLLDQQGELIPEVSWGQTHGSINRAAVLTKNQARQTIAQWCVDNDQIATIGRLDEDPREGACIHAIRADNNLGSTCCIPLKHQDGVFGAMLLTRSRDMLEFSEAHIDMFQAVVNLLSSTVNRIGLSGRLRHQAFHDPLTGLPNRYQLERILFSAIEEASTKRTPLCVIFLDLDGFKDVNDTSGHAMGDSLLCAVAGRLSSIVGGQDTLVRMGGDEFALIVDDGSLGENVAGALLESLESPFNIEGEIVNISASIGIGLFPDNAETAESLLKCADEAMYQAKREGKGCVRAYDESLAIASRQRSLLELQLRDGIEKQEFHLLYQPQVRCGCGEVVGVEALIRWRHPTRGLVPPGEFIPVAESSGLINPIGRWVVDEATRQLARWQGTSAEGIRVSINIAASQFHLSDFCEQIIEALELNSVSAELLELEVTESVLMNDMSLIVSHLERLRALGVRVAIDDFGTGYSSLGYLQELPLDVLKIDRSFVSCLVGQGEKASLIETIQTLATSLGLETVAEGVEYPEQLELIRSLGCNLAQGYLYSRPVPAAKIPTLIETIQSQSGYPDTYRTKSA